MYISTFQQNTYVMEYGARNVYLLNLFLKRFQTFDTKLDDVLFFPY